MEMLADEYLTPWSVADKILFHQLTLPNLDKGKLFFNLNIIFGYDADPNIFANSKKPGLDQYEINNILAVISDDLLFTIYLLETEYVTGYVICSLVL